MLPAIFPFFFHAGHAGKVALNRIVQNQDKTPNTRGENSMSNEIKLPEFLKQDPYMITAEQTRKERLSDPLVPRYHYIVSHEYMNDPNGL